MREERLTKGRRGRMTRKLSLSALAYVMALGLLIAIGPQILAAQPATSYEIQVQDLKVQPQAGDWNIYTVDSPGKIRGYVSIALDSDDYPHMSYYNISIHDPTDGDLRYAKWVGSNWSIETVDFNGDVGHTNSMTLDSNGYPHIGYYDNTNNDLKYARWDGSAWAIETVDSYGKVGMHPSIAIDSNSYPHISYLIQIHVGGVGHYEVKHATWDGAAWIIETVDTNVWLETSLALDSHDFPHISYHDAIGLDLKYAKWTGSAWSIEIVDSPGILQDFSSLALDSRDFPHIGYYDGTNDDLKYARWTGSAWSIETVDSIGRVGQCVSIALDKNDYPHMSYLSGDSGLKYVRWNGTAWNFEIVDPIGGDWTTTSIAVDSHDYPHISYSNRSRDSLKYATKAKPQKPHVNLNIDPDTLNLKSRGRWITAYLTTENAKAEDIDASSLLLNDVVRPDWWDVQNDTTLMVKFNRSAVQAILPVSVAIDIKVTGQWKDGETFELHDIIRVIQPGRVPLGPESVPNPRELLMSAQRDFERACPHMPNAFRSVQ
jgi:hypothetical protein